MLSPKNHTSFSLVGLQHAEFAHTEHKTRRDVRVRKDVTLISVILQGILLLTFHSWPGGRRRRKEEGGFSLCLIECFPCLSFG